MSAFILETPEMSTRIKRVDPVALFRLRVNHDFCNCSQCSGGLFRTVIVFLKVFSPPSADLSIIARYKSSWLRAIVAEITTYKLLYVTRPWLV